MPSPQAAPSHQQPRAERRDGHDRVLRRDVPAGGDDEGLGGTFTR
jgi:hypothetical protein